MGSPAVRGRVGSVCPSPCLGLWHGHVPCPGASQVFTAQPWLGPTMPESRSDAQPPEGPSVPSFCFHSLLGPCLLEAPSPPQPLSRAVLGPCPVQQTSLPGGTWWVAGVGGNPRTPNRRPRRLLARTVTGLLASSGHRGALLPSQEGAVSTPAGKGDEMSLALLLSMAETTGRSAVTSCGGRAFPPRPGRHQPAEGFRLGEEVWEQAPRSPGALPGLPSAPRMWPLPQPRQGPFFP